ncbi:MAG TPA: hypothetical protein VJ456_01235 [Acidimicrobiia bacterium]|nr:hypothetical protein [Acidimicrobiia bacterium]
MNGPGRAGHRHLFLLLAPLLLASIAVPAARSGAAESGDGASASQVAEGLKTIQDIAADAAVAAGKDKEKAQKTTDGIEAVWSKIEDTVRANDKDAYITFEDSFETLGAAAKAGDAKKAGGASDAIAAAVKAYVAKHPAAPAPASAPAAHAAEAATPAPAARAAEAATANPSATGGDAPTSAAAARAGDAALARTGPHAASGLTALAGAAFGLGGLAVTAGARRRPVRPIA